MISNLIDYTPKSILPGPKKNTATTQLKILKKYIYIKNHQTWTHQTAFNHQKPSSLNKNT